MKLSRLLVAASIITILTSGCASRDVVAEADKSATTRTETVESPIPTKTRSLAESRGDHVVSTVKFEPGQNSLSSNARSEIERAIRLAKANGEIDTVTVVVWSDEEYPGQGSKLPREQVRLANQRGNEIEEFIEDQLDSGPVAVHNMARNPNAVSRVFKTADARLKQQLVDQGIAPTSEDKPVVSGRASTALVLVRTDAGTD